MDGVRGFWNTTVMVVAGLAWFVVMMAKSLWARVTWKPELVGGEKSGWSYPYSFDFLAVPTLILLALWLTPAFDFMWWVMAACGLVFGTLAEYAVHRWGLHKLYWYGIHEHHHKHPSDWQVFTWWQLPAVWLLAALFFPIGMFVGFMVWLIWFLCWHHALHHFENDGIPWIAQYGRWHDLHHKDLPVNYGITHGAMLWDYVFHTNMSLVDGERELMARAEIARLEKAQGRG